MLDQRTRPTIATYLRYLSDAFFLIVNEKSSFSARKRIMNPKKVYLLDPGFAKLGVPFSESRGALLENMVAVELRRRGAQMLYFRGRGECDFILVEGRTPIHAMQLCWELNGANRARELAGLAEAMGSLSIRHGTIVTYDTEGRATHAGAKVTITPVWRWLLW